MKKNVDEHSVMVTFYPRDQRGLRLGLHRRGGQACMVPRGEMGSHNRPAELRWIAANFREKKATNPDDALGLYTEANAQN